MLISYCTTCHKRLWQLKLTLDENLTFTKVGEVELCIAVYNDQETYDYLLEHYAEYIEDKRLVVMHRIDDKPFSCGYVKNFAHRMGTGKILFNLDADNFIDTAHAVLLTLNEDEMLRHSDGGDVGLSGRIGIYKTRYDAVGGYRDFGRYDDGDFISRLLRQSGTKLKMKRHTTTRGPIANSE